MYTDVADVCDCSKRIRTYTNVCERSKRILIMILIKILIMILILIKILIVILINDYDTDYENDYENGDARGRRIKNEQCDVSANHKCSRRDVSQAIHDLRQDGLIIASDVAVIISHSHRHIWWVKLAQKNHSA